MKCVYKFFGERSPKSRTPVRSLHARHVPADAMLCTHENDDRFAGDCDAREETAGGLVWVSGWSAAEPDGMHEY